MWNYKIYNVPNQPHNLDWQKNVKYRSIAPYFVLPLALERSNLGSPICFMRHCLVSQYHEETRNKAAVGEGESIKGDCKRINSGWHREDNLGFLKFSADADLYFVRKTGFPAIIQFPIF